VACNAGGYPSKSERGMRLCQQQAATRLVIDVQCVNACKGSRPLPGQYQEP
jgi:hypothetical protein